MPDFLSAFYLVGSIALGEFNPRFSDIDFIAVLSRKAGEKDLARLREIHRDIQHLYPTRIMEGCYLQPGDLGKTGEEAGPHPLFHDGKFNAQARHQHDQVTWWVLKHNGVPLIGFEPDQLPYTPDWEQLIRQMHTNMNTYWASWTKKPGRIAALLSDWGIHWAVLGALRQFYTFRENGITSKTKAGQYGLTCLPDRWHPIIREAIRLREGIGEKEYRFRTIRAIEAVRLIRYIIKESNRGSNIP